MAYIYTLAGVDISPYVNEKSISIHDALGNGPGALTAAGVAKITEAYFDVALGTAAQAVGPGQFDPSPAYDLAIMSLSPILYYKENEVTGVSQVTDYGSQNKPLTTISNSPTFGLSGPFGSATSIGFNGTNQSISRTGITTLPTGAAAWTTETWVYPADAAAGEGAAVTWGGNYGSTDAVMVMVSGGTVYLRRGSSTTTTAYSIPINSWSHIVLSYDGTNIRHYINGVLRNTAAMTYSLSATSAVVLGDVAGGTTHKYYKGRSAKTAIYAYQLSDTQVANNYVTGRTTNPQLIRQGELIITDNITGNTVFGGYVVDMEDKTSGPFIQTHIRAHDYWSDLDRVIINEQYDNTYDVDMIKALLAKYAPSIDTSLLGSNNILLTRKNYRQKTLQNALLNIASTAGFYIYVDQYKKIHYYAPTDSPAAPFSLSSAPDYATSQPYLITAYEQDDTAIINRVFFYGGKKPSADFTNTLSPQADGTNKVFILAYFPVKDSTGHITVKINGVTKNLGYALGDQSSAANKLTTDGGTADVLIDSSAKTLTFATAPLATDTVVCIYRYQVPLVMSLTAADSYQFFGRYYDGVIADDTVFDTSIAAQRCRLLLSQQKFGLLNFTVTVYTAGINAGQLLSVYHAKRGINATYLVQNVESVPLGNGQYNYNLTLGAWSPGVAAMLMAAARQSTLADDNAEEAANIIQIPSAPVSAMTFSLTLSSKHGTPGAYQADTAVHGDGTDAYCGFCSI